MVVFSLFGHRDAAAAEVEVVTSDCALRADELERLVRLELSAVVAGGGEAARWSVDVRCLGTAMEITLHDPLTRKTVQRSVQRPDPEEAEPERMTALTVAQLYRAAWLELVADDPPPLPPTSPAVASPAHEAAAAAARGTLPSGVMDRSDTERGRWSLAAAGTLTARAFGDAAVLPGVTVEGAWSPRDVPLWIGLAIAWETVELQRQQGDVGVDVLRVGPKVIGDVAGDGRWAVLAQGDVSLTHVTMAAGPVDRGYVGGVVDGVGVDGAIGLGGALRLGLLRLELLADVGILVGTPAGRVAGAAPIDLGGGRVGGELRIRMAP